MKYQAYPEYKDSGIEWLEGVPKEWCVSKVKNGYYIQLGKMLQSEAMHPNNKKISYLKSLNVQWEKVLIKENTQMWASPYESKQYGIKSGDLLVCEGGEVGRSAIIQNVEKPLIIQNALHRVRAKKKFDNRYLLYYLVHVGSTTWFDVLCNKSTITHFTVEKISNLDFLMPMFNEQTTIANFLDRETQRIDVLVEEKKDFLQLLKEKRLALISHAVTKGLDSSVKMKASGVDWLGDVPEHWQVKKIKHLFQIRKRIAGKLGFPVLSITQKGIKVKDTVTGTGQLSMDYSKYQIVKVGDFAMNHMDLLTGYVDLSKFNGVTSPDYRVFALTDSNSIDRYYLYLMQMGYKDKIFFGYGQGVANIGRWRFQTEAFSNFNVPYPDKKEQQEIADFLDSQMVKLDSLTQETQKSIDLLKEHRTALISAAVTGKIDVRGLA